MSIHRRQHLVLLTVLMIGAAALEMLPIILTVQLVSTLTGLEKFASSPHSFWQGFSTPGVPQLVALGVSVVAATGVRLWLAWLSARFVTSLAHDLGVRIFGQMIRQPLSSSLDHHSSTFLSGIEKIQTIVSSVLQPLTQAVIAAVIGTAILAVLIALSPAVTAFAAALLMLSYGAASRVTRARLLRNSELLAKLSRKRIQTVQDAIGAVRDILLDRSQPIFEKRFRELDHTYRDAQAANLFAAAAPRFLVEAAGLILFSAAAVTIALAYGSISAALPALAAAALGGQRLLPLAQQIYFGWSQTAGNLNALADVIQLVELPVEVDQRDPQPLSFEQEIICQDVSFAYGCKRPAVDCVSFSIAHGSHVGIVGPTGSGKSTLLDLILGLIDPRTGGIYVDGCKLEPATREAWHRQVAYVPQSVFIADDTIAANILFGIKEDLIKPERISHVIGLAQLTGFVKSLPDGLLTRVGERGARLSGGERQRIGIARALIRRPSLLVLDEATSALDSSTEDALFEALQSLPGLTILSVAHRPSTLRHCSKVVSMTTSGQIVQEDPRRPATNTRCHSALH